MIIEGTIREQYILAQALAIAIKQLRKVEPPVMREISNIADMRTILEENLSMFAGLELSGILLETVEDND